MLTTAVLLLLADGVTQRIADGWEVRGHHIAHYTAGVERGVAQSGRASAYIRAANQNASGFRTMMQSIQAAQFAGRRVRLSGFLKTRDARTAGLWMRVEGKPPLVLGFDNMQSRPVTGTVDWQPCQIVLDVPQGSRTIAYGFLLSGPGQVWADNLTLEAVDASVPTTGLDQGRIELMNRAKRLPRAPQWGEGVAPRLTAPVNLDFER